MLESENISDSFSYDISSIDDLDDKNVIPSTPERTKKAQSTTSLTQSSSKNHEKNPKKVKKKTSEQIQNSPWWTFEKKKKKNIIHETHEIVNIDSDNEENDALKRGIKIFVKVKRDWEGTPNYFPSSSKFEVYATPGMGESCTENWYEWIEIRKIEISNKVKEIFGDKDTVILVPYSGRIRISFPCPEHDSSRSSVDIKNISWENTNGPHHPERF